MRFCGHTMAAAGALLLLLSCSTTKVLREDERRLTSAKIEVVNDKKFNSSALVPYLKQKSANWNPFLYVYNWENGKGGGWDRFVHKLGTPPVVFDEDMVAPSQENIREHLKYIGYYDSKVEAVVDRSKDKKAKVKYYVTLGKRYRVKDISYEVTDNNVEFYKDFYADTAKTSIKVGDYLSEMALEAESARSASVLHDKGYFDFSKNYYFFEADTVSFPGMARLKVLVKDHTRNEGDDKSHDMQKYTMGRITLSYQDNLNLRPKALRNLNILKTGELYSDSKINTQYSRYSSVSYLNSVNMQLSPREDENVVDLDIQLNKGKTQGFKLGLEASISTTLLWGISPELSYYHRNIFHGGEILNVSVNTNHQIMNGKASVHSNEVTVNASLSFPKFFPLPNKVFTGPEIPRTEVKVSYNYQNRPEFVREMSSASFGYNGNIKKRFYYQANPLAINLVHLLYIDPAFFENMKDLNPAVINSFVNHFDMGISGTFQYATGNITNPKETYWYTRLSTDVSGNLLSAFNNVMTYDPILDTHYILNMPYSQYVRGEWSIGGAAFFGKNNNHSIAGRFLIGLGYGYGNSTTLPFEKRFYSGGANSLRGWTARTVGPGTSKLSQVWSIPNQTGDMKLEANLEYRFKIFWKIYGAAFVDVGNVWEVDRSRDLFTEDYYFSFKNLGESLAASWGIGLRVDLNFLVLRLDYGMRFHDPARGKGDRWLDMYQWFRPGNYAFHFGVGYPF